MKLNTLLFAFFLIPNLLYGQSISWVKSGAGNQYLSYNSRVDKGYSIVSDNNFVYLAGLVTGDYAIIDGNTYNFSNFAFLAQFDKSGNLIWLNTLPGWKNHKIMLNSSGEIYVIGEKGLNTYSKIMKYNQNGSLIWEKTLIENALYTDGLSIAIDNSDDIIISGRFYHNQENLTVEDTVINNIISGSHAFIAKYSSNGEFEWVNVTNGGHSCYFYDIEADQNNDIAIVGHFNNYESDSTFIGDTVIYSNPDQYGSLKQNILISKFSNSGDFEWVRTYGGIEDDWGNNLTTDNENNIYFTGTFIDSAIFENINLYSRGSYDIYLSKISSEGNLTWVKTIGGPYGYYSGFGYEAGRSINIDGENNLFISGTFIYNATFGEGEDQITIYNSDGVISGFFAKYSDSGKFDYVKNINGFYSEIKNIFSYEQNLYITGNFYQNVELLSVAFPVTFPDTYNFFFSCIDLNLSSTNELDINDNYLIFPNPSNGYLAIDQILEPKILEIFDINGKSVFQINNPKTNYLDIKHLKSGIYFLKIYTKNMIITKKLIRN